jgi:hypothetical protein
MSEEREVQQVLARYVRKRMRETEPRWQPCSQKTAA